MTNPVQSSKFGKSDTVKASNIDLPPLNTNTPATPAAKEPNKKTAKKSTKSSKQSSGRNNAQNRNDSSKT